MSALIPFPNISNEIFSITLFGQDFALRWYAIAYILGIIIAWRLTARTLARPALWQADTPPMTRDHLEDLVTWAIIGVILGGRMGYVLFYRPAYFLEYPSEILKVWTGGMSFHGGFLGVVLAALIFALLRRLPLLKTADAIAIGVPWGLMLGRIANFINAELWGRPTTVPWGVAFPGTAAQDCPEIIGLCARHPSQLYEAALEGLLLGLLILWLAYRRGALKMPGFLAGVFFAGYGAARFVVEMFRQADGQFITPENPAGYVLHLGQFGLTMGQILSLPMIGVGLVFIIVSRLQNRSPGGA